MRQHFALMTASAAIVTARLCAAGGESASLHWSQLPPLPDTLGVAGAFAGVSGGALLVAGGANFPEKLPWEGGKKIWHDTVYALDRTNGSWRVVGKLPRPLGYGVSLTTERGVLCIGGSDAERHFRDVFLLSWSQRGLKTTTLPPLPAPVANFCGALVGNTVYLAGGMASPEAANALKKFWALNLQPRRAQWRELPPWPGPARMLSVAAAVSGSFYLAGGTDIVPNATGQPVRAYLKDAYRFTPDYGWQRIADLPNPVVAAPTPAPVVGHTSFLLVGGDDGGLVNFEPKSKHPGFPKRILSYDTQRDAWSILDETPAARATLPTVAWHGWTVMPSGESKPGVRSPEVWAVRTVDRGLSQTAK